MIVAYVVCMVCVLGHMVSIYTALASVVVFGVEGMAQMNQLSLNCLS